MRRYETIFIIDSDLSEDQHLPVFERLTDLISQYEGLLVMNEKWGVRKLAYDIKKKPRGYYVRLEYCGNGLLVDEIERFFRIDDRVLKYMTVLIDQAVDLEKVKEEIVQREAAEKAAAESSPAPQEAVTEAEQASPKDSETETEQAPPKDAEAETDPAKQAPEKTPDTEPAEAEKDPVETPEAVLADAEPDLTEAPEAEKKDAEVEQTKPEKEAS
jgi:small subunit ribosomal protein S6